MKYLNLNEVNWKEYLVGDIFQIENCKCSKASDLKKGGMVPYVGATNRNNGTMYFVDSNQLITQGNCIVFICDGEGSIGYSIYKYENFIGSTTLKVGRNKYLNKYNGMFITTIADKIRGRYNFGYKRNTSNLKREVLILPSSDNGIPDWIFMEEYMKQVEKELIAKSNKYFKSKISEISYNIQSYDSLKWKEFEIEDLFNIKIGKNIDGNKIDKMSGNTPYVTRKEADNGIDGFIDGFESSYLNCYYPVITIGNETAKPFVQSYHFYTGTKVNILIPKHNLNQYHLQFISRCLEQQKFKYSYSFSANSTRLKKQTILLPIDSDLQPDYEFMEKFIRKIERQLIGKWFSYKNELVINTIN